MGSPEKNSKPRVRREQRVEMNFLEGVRRRCPKHLPTLEALGHMFTQSGRYEDGLRVDLELTGQRPDEPLYWYNLACSYALTRRDGDALAALQRAIDLGYRDLQWLMQDEDLRSLRFDPRFIAILQQLQLG